MQHLLEVEGQVGGNDGNVHEVDYVFMLPPVQVLVDVQALWRLGLVSELWQVLPVILLSLTLRAWPVYSSHPNMALICVTQDQPDSHLLL